MQPNTEQSARTFLLDGLRVNPVSGLVSGPGGEIRLEPRVMSLLRALAGRPGVLVTRAELLAEIWPGDGVYDEALTQCVYQLRQQLGEAAGNTDSRQLVKTVPKRGYVLQAKVQFESPKEVTPADSTATGSRDGHALEKVPTRPRYPLAIGALVGVLVLVATWIVLKAPPGTPDSDTVPSIQSIAVLPFLPLVAEQRDAPLELGMADSLITQLSTQSQIVVRPINAVRRFIDLERNGAEIGKLLQVDAIIDGTIQRQDNELRVSARLLRVADGQALWAGSFNSPFSGVFALQDEICEQIAASLAPQLKPGFAKSGTGGTSNIAAYELFLKARYHMDLLTRDDLFRSLDYFQQAVDLDPGYAQAWLGLASVNFRLPLAGEVPPGDHYAKARESAQKALAIDPTLAAGHAYLGWVSFWSEHDWDAAERHFRRAIQLNPNEFEGHAGYAHLLSNIGRHDEALAEIRRARQINPLFAMSAVLEAGFMNNAGRTEEAVRLIEEATRKYPDFWLARLNLAVNYRAAGRLGEALAEVRRARELAPDSTWVQANQVQILNAAGETGEARELLATMVEKSQQQYVSPYHLAKAFMGIGDDSAALAWLDRAVEENNPMLVFLAADDIWLELRGLPEFDTILQEVNLANVPH